MEKKNICNIKYLIKQKMKYYVAIDCMCSTNVAFNIKTGENILIFCRFLSFENFFELTFSFLSFNFYDA